MYETLGFNRSASEKQSIKLFIPDNTIDPAQYTRGGISHIKSVSNVSDFQHFNRRVTILLGDRSLPSCSK